MTRLIVAALLLVSPVVAGAAPPADRAETMQLTATVMAEKVITAGGTQRVELRKPDLVVPGDRLVLETAYRNTGAAAVKKFVVTNPVPNGVAYAGDASPGAEFSVDGGRTWGRLADLKTAGATVRPATAADVSHLRWTLATVAPGVSGSVRYRGVVR